MVVIIVLPYIPGFKPWKNLLLNIFYDIMKELCYIGIGTYCMVCMKLVFEQT